MTGTTAFNYSSFPAYGCQNDAPCSQKLTVFCDFDGPIVDVSERYYSTYQLVLDQVQEFYQAQGEILPLRKLTKQQFWQMKQERVSDDEIAMRSGLQGQQIQLFLQYVKEVVNQPTLLHKDKMQQGVNWALALLHSQGIELILVTLRCQTQVTQILQNYRLARLFSGIYGTHDCQMAYQNNADAKTQLLRQAISASIQTPACLVGDTEADIVAAKALGVSAVALTCGIRSRAYLQQFQPDRIYSDLLSAAHHLLGITCEGSESLTLF